MNTGNFAKLLMAVPIAVSCCIGTVSAKDLKIGITGMATSIDPHFATSSRNFPVNGHVFEPLVRLNDDAVPSPWLAKSWKIVNDTTWEFKLRDDIKWHDGSPFTAADVAFTLGRAGKVPNTPSSYATYLRPIDRTEIVDPHTIRIITKGPAAALLDNLSYILVVSKKNGEGATTQDYHSGKAMVGTGPYKFANWAPSDFLQLTRNDDYWGGKEPWTSVRLQVMSSASSRMAAVLAGDIDVADSVPPQDVERLTKDKRVNVWSRASNRIVFGSIDGGIEALKTGLITGPNGEPLKTNPLADQRVRTAMRLAINLEAFTKHLYKGTAVAAGQFLLPGRPGNAPDLKAWKFDAKRATKLLKDAGWHKKFRVTISVSAAFYPLALQATEAIAQSWSQVGVLTQVKAMPYAVTLRKRNARELPIFTTAFNNVWGTPENFYATVFHTRPKSRRYGALNFPRYSNAKVDALLEKGFGTMDNKERAAMYAEASKLIVGDAHFVPLWHVHTITATRADLKYNSRADAFLYAQNVRSK